MASEGRISPFYVSNCCISVSHLSFADDVIIFRREERHSPKHLIDFLDLYQKGFGQKINKSKSFYVISDHASSGLFHSITYISGITKTNFPFVYLGCNLNKGRRKVIIFTTL